MLSEISQTQKGYDNIYIWNLKQLNSQKQRTDGWLPGQKAQFQLHKKILELYYLVQGLS